MNTVGAFLASIGCMGWFSHFCDAADIVSAPLCLCLVLFDGSCPVLVPHEQGSQAPEAVIETLPALPREKR